ncbi:MAG: sigma-54-dependent transcriptional regulator [Cellvibrionaceae bacterium]
MSSAVKEDRNEMIPKVLVVEDDPSLREALQDTLSLAKYESIAAPDAETALQLLAKHNDIVMIVSDVNMGKMSGHDLLRQVKIEYAHIPMLLITAYASISDSVDAIRHGAIDYLVKPFEPKSLLDIVAKYLDGKEEAVNDEPIAKSPSSQQLLQLAQRMAQTDSTVLIIGESGTGKEVLARYIHQQSPRVKEPFIAINCAAIPENMLEAILFGYEKGAYTGAYSSAPGKFEQANGGTLLLDEISEMDMGLQAKLLRVLQEREVERLGGRKTIELDVRVIATSNRNMQKQVAEGKFREDLYYRLSVLPLQWQPLRARREDILPLANRLLKKHATKQKRNGVKLADSAQQALYQYNWPGNVRELDNVIQRALILQTGLLISDIDLGLDMLAPVQEFNENIVPVAPVIATNTLDGLRSSQDNSNVLGDDLKQREFEIIADTLKEERGSRKNTAERLGISPRTLRYKLAKMRDMGFNIDGLMDIA